MARNNRYISKLLFDIASAVVACLIILLCCSVFPNTINETAFAETNSDFKPTCQIRKEMAGAATRQAELSAAIEQSTAIITNYETNSNQFTAERIQNETKLAQLQSYIEEEEPNMQEVQKNTFAAIFAKSLLDDIVGNDFISSNVFHWNLVLLLTENGEEEIYNLLSDYVETKKNYETALYNEQNTELVYHQAKEQLPAMQAEFAQLQPSIDYFNAQLSNMAAIEAKYGAAGESRLTGNGQFNHPLPNGQVTSTVGEQRDGYVHKGLDLCAPTDTPIYCAQDGIVVEATYTEDYNQGYGMFMRIKTDDGYLTTYMHCSHVYVPVGMRVHKGDNIARVGSTGDSTGPHLHFQVEKDGQIINGAELINR